MAVPGTQQNKGYSDVLALGFAISVAMWEVVYLMRLPAVAAPAPLTTGAIGVALALGGYFAGRYGRRGWIGGLWAGLISGLLNLLIVLSAVSERFSPGAAEPINPLQFALVALGTVAASGIICGVGAAIGNTNRARAAELPNWTAILSKTAVFATFFLLVAGGLVTGSRAGLSVPDWPSSFGHNMFLLPLSQMGDPQVFLEHAHRLWGALVGLTVLTLAIHLSLVPGIAKNVRLAAWIAFALVALQGVLGGLRVVDKATSLGALHGLLAQIIFGIVVGVAVTVSTTWFTTTTVKRYASAGTDRVLPIITLVLLVIQIGLGAEIRHFQDMDRVMLHITVALLVLALALFTGIRAWGLHPDVRIIRRRGVGLIHLTIVQIVLGVLALVLGGVTAKEPTFGQAIWATVHQAFGALLLAWTVNVMLWNRKVLLPVEDSGTRAAA